MSEAPSKLGALIRARRERLGLSQENLAASAEMSRTYLGEIERGGANPSITTLERLAHALGMKLSELVRLYEEENE